MLPYDNRDAKTKICDLFHVRPRSNRLVGLMMVNQLHQHMGCSLARSEGYKVGLLPGAGCLSAVLWLRKACAIQSHCALCTSLCCCCSTISPLHQI